MQVEGTKPGIIYFGTSGFAVPPLRSLINFGHNIIAVITQPEKPAGRLRVLVPSPVKRMALEENLSVLEPHTLRDDDFLAEFKRLRPDLCVVAAYGKIIPSTYLDVPKYGFLNIHPSILPEYRGPSPIQTAIMNGDKKTGVSLLVIDKEVDHGPILKFRDYELNSGDYYKKIELELAGIGAELLTDILPEYIAGKIKPEPQDHSKATLTKIITRHDGRIVWHRTGEEIFNQIRALNPEPGTWTLWRAKVLNIRTVGEILERDIPESPGTIVRINSDIAVAAKKCYLILKRIQLEGGKEMDAITFLNGHPDFVGSQLE